MYLTMKKKMKTNLDVHEFTKQLRFFFMIQIGSVYILFSNNDYTCKNNVENLWPEQLFFKVLPLLFPTFKKKKKKTP